MERHVVLAHELHVAHVVRALVGAPPAFPVLALAGVHPFRGAGDVFDGRVEPHVEDLALHAGPVLVALPDRDAPVEVPRDATVLQAVAVIEPFLGDGGGQHWPVGLGLDPFAKLVAHQGLAQVEMLGLPHLEVGGARDRRTRLDQVGGVELLGAVLALVAACLVVPAVRAGALDIAVRQEASIGPGIDLLFPRLPRSARSRRACPAKCCVSLWFCGLEDRPK